jgi:hypothetical protein
LLDYPEKGRQMEHRPERTLSVALTIAAKKESDQVGMELEVNVSQLCEVAGVNRAYAYELADHVDRAVAGLRDRRPGRPATEHSAEPVRPDPGARLTVEVLEYRLAHPGALVEHGGRSTYAAGFKRFILGRYDAAVPARMDQDEFARVVRLPCDTLRNWVACDRQKLDQQADQAAGDRAKVRVPEDASDVVLRLVDLHASWHGSTRELVPHAARALEIKPAEVVRALRILGIIAPRKARRPKYPGSTRPLEPGSMSVVDGKDVAVRLSGTERWDKRVVHVVEDQATNTATGVAAARSECAAAAAEAFDAAVEAQGGKPPLGLLVDNKPCYEDAGLRSHVEATTVVVPATPGRGENKALLEGTFSEWERQVGTVVLDDSTPERLVTSAVREAMRAFLAGRNHAPRIEHGGKSRIQVLQEACPTQAQRERDLAFIRNLKARHEATYPTYSNERSRALLEEGFLRWKLVAKDPTESLRRYLSYCEPEAVRRGFAIFATKMARGTIKAKFAHRYLAKLIQSNQEELDLERAEDELLKSADVERRWWAVHDEETYREIHETTNDPGERLQRIAEMAAEGGLPINGAFWRKKLREEVKANIEHAPAVRRHVKRLYEAELNVKLGLIALVADVEAGLAN